MADTTTSITALAVGAVFPIAVNSYFFDAPVLSLSNIVVPLGALVGLQVATQYSNKDSGEGTLIAGALGGGAAAGTLLGLPLMQGAILGAATTVGLMATLTFLFTELKTKNNLH